MMSHQEARAHIVEGFKKSVLAREPNTAEAQILAGIALLETGYGSWWKGAGVGSFNMGAITAGSSWVAEGKPTFEYRDSKPDPNRPGVDIWYTTKFRKYASAADGFADLVRVAYITNGRNKAVLPHASAGDVYGVSAGLYATVYYTGRAIYPTPEARIRAHYGALVKHVANVAAALGEKLPDGSRPPPPTIKRGSRGAWVKEWQRVLETVVVDGMFGPITEAATKLWQKAHGLKEDGIVGPKTWGAAQQWIEDNEV